GRPGGRHPSPRRAASPTAGAPARCEVTDRAQFLATLRARLAAPAPSNTAHPMPPPLTDGIPVVRSSLVDPDDLVGSFERNAVALRAYVHRVDAAAITDELLDDIVAKHGVQRVVVSRDP